MKVRLQIMGENWMGLWAGILVFGFFGLFVISVAIYDYCDRKKRNQEIKLRKYILAVLIGLILMLPILTGGIFWILRLFI